MLRVKVGTQRQCLLIGLFSILMSVSFPALAEKRVALLIGNESYGSAIGHLANPHNDVALLEQALKSLGFDVVVVRDVGLGALTRAVNAYARRIQAAGPGTIAFFYYSGHGASDGSANYLIPVDAKTIETGALWDESLQLTEITRKLRRDAGNATHFVVFDACRNTLKLTQPSSRAVVQSKGFVPVAQENGMLIAYATAEGELASDVGAGAGPYARVLAEEIVKPGVEAVVMFRAVQRRVRVAIHQEPYLGFNALGDVYLAGTNAKPPELAPLIASPAPLAKAESVKFDDLLGKWCGDVSNYVFDRQTLTVSFHNGHEPRVLKIKKVEKGNGWINVIWEGNGFPHNTLFLEFSDDRNAMYQAASPQGDHGLKRRFRRC